MAGDVTKLVPRGAPNANGESRPARSPSQVRAEIERAREQIAQSMTALRQQVVQRTDWREWVRSRPALCIGAAFAVGFWIGNRRDRR